MLSALPELEPEESNSKYAAHSRDIAIAKSSIINSHYHVLEYHIIKVDKGGEYKLLKYELPINELWKIVLLRMLEKIV